MRIMCLNATGFSISLLVVMALLITPTSGWNRTPQKNADKKNADKIVAQANKAVWGEMIGDGVKSFSVTWKLKRVGSNGVQHTGETSFDVLLPNKLVKKGKLNLAENIGQITNEGILNGEKATYNRASSNSDIKIIEVGKVGNNSESERSIFKQLRRDLAFQLLSFMLALAPEFPIKLYIGEAEIKDRKADVIDAKIMDDLTVRLFIDQSESRLLMMSWNEPSITQLILAGKQPTHPVSEVNDEVRAYFSDYRPVNGAMLPHLVIYERNGAVYQEDELKIFKVNPSFNPNHFEIAKDKKTKKEM